jgi:3,4-dihydroxy 2-butanone 4-phosphate synthase/GTP cyclohydrolase II
VIVEILSEDGTMARRPELERFAAEHGLKIGTVADLIRYRLETEKTVVRSAESVLSTRHGDFRLLAYEDALDRTVHFALVRGNLDPEMPTLVRVHVENTLTDLLALDDPEGGWPLKDALAYMGRQEQGVLVVLRKPEPPFALLQRVREQGLPTRPPAHRPGVSGVLRTHGIGAQILKDLGVHRMRVLSSTRRFQAISGFGLEVVEVVSPD